MKKYNYLKKAQSSVSGKIKFHFGNESEAIFGPFQQIVSTNLFANSAIVSSMRVYKGQIAFDIYYKSRVSLNYVLHPVMLLNYIYFKKTIK